MQINLGPLCLLDPLTLGKFAFSLCALVPSSPVSFSAWSIIYSQTASQIDMAFKMSATRCDDWLKLGLTDWKTYYLVTYQGTQDYLAVDGAYDDVKFVGVGRSAVHQALE